MDKLYKQIGELEVISKRKSGVEEEVIQIKKREKELQRIIDETKAEADGLRAKAAAGSSNEGSSKLL